MDLSFLEKKGTIKLLLFMLNKPPLRFKDLKKTLPREATLSLRLKELEKLKLIESISINGKEKYFAYELTGKGLDVVELLERLVLCVLKTI